MNLGQLESYAKKPAVLGAAAAGVVGLALLQRRKAGGDAAAPAAPAVPASGSYSAGGQVASAGGFGAYDSTASDVAGWLSPQLDELRRLSSPTPVPAPIASTLFAPSGTGNYVRRGDGLVAEVQSDGSLFGMTLDQWVKAGQPSATDLAGLPNTVPIYSTQTNVTTAGTAAAK